MLLACLGFFIFSLVAAILNTKLCSIFPFPLNKLYINSERYDGKTQTLAKSMRVHKVDFPPPRSVFKVGALPVEFLGRQTLQTRRAGAFRSGHMYDAQRQRWGIRPEN